MLYFYKKVYKLVMKRLSEDGTGSLRRITRMGLSRRCGIVTPPKVFSQEVTVNSRGLCYLYSIRYPPVMNCSNFQGGNTNSVRAKALPLLEIRTPTTTFSSSCFIYFIELSRGLRFIKSGSASIALKELKYFSKSTGCSDFMCSILLSPNKIGVPGLIGKESKETTFESM